MNQKDLTHYRKLYQTAQRMGADKLLIDFLGLEKNSVVPLSVSHGVDFGQLHEPIDIWRPEPIHWSYNHDMHAQAKKHKQSLHLPHPWAIESTLTKKSTPKSSGTLIIGPPPSQSNDEALFDILSPVINSTWSILLKHRGNERDSYKFWQERGIKIVSAGEGDSGFYSRLHTILSQYDSVIGCTFSSAVIFAASIGKDVQLLEDYTYRVYDLPRYVKMVNHSSPQAKNTVSIFINRSRSEIGQHARDLLGFDLLQKNATLKKSYEGKINSNTALFHPIRSIPMLTPILAEIALWLGRPGALKITPKLLLDETINRQLIAKEINEISCWVDGPSASNYRMRPIKYKKDKTKGGMGF